MPIYQDTPDIVMCIGQHFAFLTIRYNYISNLQYDYITYNLHNTGCVVFFQHCETKLKTVF
jgi:hypothetical protein